MSNTYDLVVIGAGPAGLAGAVEAAQHGLSVLVLDEQPEAGGQIYRSIRTTLRLRPQAYALLGPDYQNGKTLAAAFRECEIEHQSSASVWQVTPDRTVHFLQNGAVQEVRAKRLLLYFPDSPEAAQADLGLTVEDLSDAERLRRAQRLMKRFDYAAARPELKRLSEHPKLGRDARWELANIGLTKLRDDPEGARRLFRREMTLGGPRKEEALFSLIRTYVKDDRYTEALRLADRYDRAYPRGKYAERIGYYRGWLPYDERDCKRALPGLERYVQRFGKRKSYVRGFIAWCHIRQESWSAAVKAFDALVGYNGPLTTGKAFYWQAYALHKMGKRSKARKKLDALQARFPLTYYAMLGRQMLASWEGRDPRASQVPWPDGGLAAAEAARLDPEAWSWPRLLAPSR